MTISAPAGDRPRLTGSAGMATIWVLTVGLVLLFSVSVGVTLTAVLRARNRATTAADMAALAAARAYLRGTSDPCAQATALAERNGAQVRHCAVAGTDVRVWVSVPVTGLAGLLPLPVVTGRARAGPALRAPA